MTIAWMNPQGIHTLTVHCAATPEGRNSKASEVRAWDIERFGQPSYHYVIELDGTVVRHLGDNQRGAHTGGKNTGNIGVCYVGGCDAAMNPKDTRTAAQKAALLKIIKGYIVRFPRIRVLGHRDHKGVAKACPSFDVAAWLKSEGVKGVPA